MDHQHARLRLARITPHVGQRLRHVRLPLRDDRTRRRLAMEIDAQLQHQRLGGLRRLAGLHRLDRDADAPDLRQHRIGTDIAIGQQHAGPHRDDALGAQRTVIADRRQLLDLRRVDRGQVARDQVRLRADIVDELVDLLGDADHPVAGIRRARHRGQGGRHAGAEEETSGFAARQHDRILTIEETYGACGLGRAGTMNDIACRSSGNSPWGGPIAGAAAR